MQGFSPWLLVAILLFSGCTQPAQDDVEPTTPTTPTTSTTYPPYEPPVVGNRTLDPWSLEPELTNCLHFPMVFEVDRAKVQSRLPEGYQAGTGTTDETVLVGLTILSCESIILDNQTVISPYQLAMVRVRVEVNETLAGDFEVNSYLFEIFSSNETVHKLFLAAGLPSILATIEVSGSMGQHAALVRTEAGTWYDAELTGGVAPPPDPESRKARYHHRPGQGPAAWIDFNSTGQESSDAAAVALQTQRGFIHDVRLANTPSLAGLSNVADLGAKLRFAHL